MIYPNRCRALRDRVGSALAYQMRHRNPHGALEVLENYPALADEAGGRENLRELIHLICATAHKAEIHMPAHMRERWALWTFDLVAGE